MMTVQDMLGIRELGLGLLAGRQSLNDPVRWVHLWESPDLLEGLKGGEVLLTTGAVFGRCEGGDFAAIVERLNDIGISGLGLGLGYEYAEAPAELVGAAEAAELPLFVVSRNVPLSGIAEIVVGRVVAGQTAMLQRSQALADKLATLALNDAGAEAIVELLTTLTDTTSLVFSFTGEVLATARAKSSRRVYEPELLWREIEGRRYDESISGVELDAGVVAQLIPIVAGHRIAAFLVVVKAGGVWGEHEELVLRHCTMALGLEYVKRQALDRLSESYLDSVIERLVDGVLRGAHVGAHLSRLGLNGEGVHLVLIVDPQPASLARATKHGGAACRVDDLELMFRLRWVVDRFFARRRRRALSVRHDGRVVIILEAGRESADQLRELAADLSREIAGELDGLAVSIGVGRVPESVGDLRRSYFEALYALKLRQLETDESGIADHRDLGVYGLLLGMQDRASLEIFAEGVLGDVFAYDRRMKTQLVHSLDVFLDLHGRWGEAAARLYVHRHTLRYRMTRLEEITGRDLEKPQDRMEFWLALRAYELAETLRERDPGGCSYGS